MIGKKLTLISAVLVSLAQSSLVESKKNNWRLTDAEKHDDDVPKGYVYPWDDFSQDAFQGDILATYSDVANAFGQKTARKAQKAGKLQKYQRRGRGRHLGAIRDLSSTLWPNAIVPYAFEASVTASLPRDRVRQAFADIHMRTGIIFQEKQPTDSGDMILVHFVNGGRCSSYIGNVGGKQKLELRWSTTNNGCVYGKIIKHEIFHALGMFHEQNSKNRDNFVKINWSNIQPKYDYNYDKVDYAKQLGVPYDYRSAMHYGPYDTAIDYSKFTMEAIGGTAAENLENTLNMGKGGVAKSDLVGLHLMYHCSLNGVGSGVHEGIRSIWELCDSKCPCHEGQGHCTSDDGCIGNLKCVSNANEYSYRLWGPLTIPNLNVCQNVDGTTTKSPTKSPTKKPTPSPTKMPTPSPTKQPTSSPTMKPTTSPTRKPTSSPTMKPTYPPVAAPTPKPTPSPTKKPTTSPTKKPTTSPTKKPTPSPTKQPTPSPTKQPTPSPQPPAEESCGPVMNWWKSRKYCKNLNKKICSWNQARYKSYSSECVTEPVWTRTTCKMDGRTYKWMYFPETGERECTNRGSGSAIALCC